MIGAHASGAMTEFFVPGAQSLDEAERLYAELRAHVDANHWGPLDDEAEGRLFRLTHVGQTKQVYFDRSDSGSCHLLVLALVGLVDRSHTSMKGKEWISGVRHRLRKQGIDRSRRSNRSEQLRL